MNVLFFLTPKSQIKYCLNSMTVRQVLELFEFYRYQVIPILSKDGSYVGTISEGDLLYFLKDHPFNSLSDFDNISMSEIKRHIDYVPISYDSEMDSLMICANNQDFVPVLDDKNNFIDIITRKSIITYLYYSKQNTDNNK